MAVSCIHSWRRQPHPDEDHVSDSDNNDDHPSDVDYIPDSADEDDDDSQHSSDSDTDAAMLLDEDDISPTPVQSGSPDVIPSVPVGTPDVARTPVVDVSADGNASSVITLAATGSSSADGTSARDISITAGASVSVNPPVPMETSTESSVSPDPVSMLQNVLNSQDLLMESELPNERNRQSPSINLTVESRPSFCHCQRLFLLPPVNVHESPAGLPSHRAP